MHIVIWTFEVMEGKSHRDLAEAVASDSCDYAKVAGLVRLYYGIAPDLKSVVEIYLWDSKAAADRFFDSEWDGAVSRRWESARMTRRDFEAPAVVESKAA